MSLEIILHVFKCLLVSLVPLKFLLLTVAPFLFILVNDLCKFAKVPGVYILLAPSGRRGTLPFLKEQMFTFSNTSKKFKPSPDIILICQCHFWIGKNTNKEFSCVMVFIRCQVALWNSNLFLVSVDVSE